MGFGNLLKQMNTELHREWTLELLKEKRPGLFKVAVGKHGQFNQTPVRFGKVDQVIYEHAEKIIDLPELHFCRSYVRERKIPQKYWNRLYFAPSFKDFADEVAPLHGKEVTKDPRLVIPYYDAYGAVVAISGRDLQGKQNALRYITIRVEVSERKLIYGLDRVNQDEPVLVVEGPLDSLFLDNAVASGDSNLILVAKQLSAKNITLVFDNEPRNKENIDQITKAIREGHKVCIWPEWIEHKDVNKMVTHGCHTPEQLQTIIRENTYSGLAALTHLTFWKKTK